MFHQRKQLLLARTQLEHQLQQQQSSVIARKNELWNTVRHTYITFLIGIVSLAVIVGWKIGQRITAVDLSKKILDSGLMFLLSHAAYAAQ